MKRIIAFILLLCTCICILAMPKTDVQPTETHAVSMWPILTYVFFVFLSALTVVFLRRRDDLLEKVAE